MDMSRWVLAFVAALGAIVAVWFAVEAAARSRRERAGARPPLSQVEADAVYGRVMRTLAESEALRSRQLRNIVVATVAAALIVAVPNLQGWITDDGEPAAAWLRWAAFGAAVLVLVGVITVQLLGPVAMTMLAIWRSAALTEDEEAEAHDRWLATAHRGAAKPTSS